jgi:hypothetical protein
MAEQLSNAEMSALLGEIAAAMGDAAPGAAAACVVVAGDSNNECVCGEDS